MHNKGGKMKPILHFKYNVGEYSCSAIDNINKYMCKSLGDDYKVIFSPFELTNPSGDTIMFSFDGIEYSYDEILNLITKKGE